MTAFDTVAAGTHPIGGYETVIELGRGGMGTAYLARATGPGGFERLVVIKRLLPQMLKRPEAVARFLDEARLAACVRHANVVATHQVGHDKDGYFLVLEYVEGASLEELVDRAALKGETIPPPIALRIALDACSGLHAAHTAKDPSGRALELLHRDISLQNLLIGSDGVTRIVDFGVAKSALGSVITEEGYVLGKLLYLPPEYLRHEKPGPDLDVYSLGVTLFIALSGNDPWPNAGDGEIVAHILGEGMPPLSSAMEVAPQIEQLVSRACDPLRTARFSSARSMANQIEAIGRQTGWLASHAEVADYVERLAGTDLERRRQTISRREVELGISERPPKSLEPNPRASSEAETLAVEAGPVVPRRRTLWPVLLAVVVVSGIGGAVLLRVATRTDASASELVSAAPAAPSQSSAPSSAEPEAVQVAEPKVEPSSEPHKPLPNATIARAAPAHTGAHPTPAKAAEPVEKPVTLPEKPAATETTSDISKQNPYRRP